MNKSFKTRSRKKIDLLIVNADELITLAGKNEKPRIKAGMKDIGIIRNGGLAIKNGTIVSVGKTSEISKEFKAEEVASANGKIVMPGFVDPHTHLIFAGSREQEFQLRIEGASYPEILRAGGDVMRTVRETRKASVEKLLDHSTKTLDIMLEHGTTTVEAKSGYGLTTKDEVKILEVARRLNQLHSVDLAPTFLGAHAIPSEFANNSEDYVKLVTEEMIPKVTERRLAEFCDVSCEKGIFTLEQAGRVLTTGKNRGLRPRLHADETSYAGGAELAAGIGAISADNLLFASVRGIRAMAEKNVVATLLPASAFSLMRGRCADARTMIDLGVPVALGTDFNPNCWVENQQCTIALACHLMNLTASEAITATTINAAHAINRAKEVGSLEVGKKADAIVLDVPNHRFLGYRFGVNLVDKVVKNGRIVFDKEAVRNRVRLLQDHEM